MLRKIVITLCLGCVSYSAHAELLTQIKLGDQQEPGKTWDASELQSLSKQKRTERDPRDNHAAHWKGILVSEFIDKSIALLPPEKRAQVDLMVFKGSAGEEVVIPRWLAIRYPLLIASQKNKTPLAIPALVIPWTSQSKILKEALPVESFFLPGVGSVEFTSYKTRFGSYYLTTRTDPAAMRGEKFFVQNCTGCHTNTPPSTGAVAGPNAAVTPAGTAAIPTLAQLAGPEHSQKLAQSGHPPIGKDLKLGDSEKRAVVSYLHAYRVEHSANSVSISK